MRKLILSTVIGCLGLGALAAIPGSVLSPTPASAQQSGLAERRAASVYQNALFPAQMKSIQMAAGFEVPVDANWDSLTLAGQADNMKEAWYITDIYVTPLVIALTKVASDEMGKGAVKEKLKKIVFKYDEATAPASNYANGLTFADGVLTLNYKPGSNGTPDQVEPRAKAIQEFLEGKL